jgi:CheY-like chemotaxis protein
MTDSTIVPGFKELNTSARNLSRSPLGIISLFIVLIYGFAALVLIFSRAAQFEFWERIPLIYFLIFFPPIVLASFYRLVTKFPNTLYPPSEYTNQENFVKMILATASVYTASSKNPQSSAMDSTSIAETVQSVQKIQASSDTKCILWVDDRPENNTQLRVAFEQINIQVSLALSTDEAMSLLRANNYSLVISDMGRKEGPREGYTLLKSMRQANIKTPFVIFATSNLPEHTKEVIENGGQGNTNNPNELFNMAIGLIIKGG